jgi:hypothetical protein
MTDDEHKGVPPFVTKTINGVEYTDIVPMYWQYNTETDDLIFGKDLREGMEVVPNSDGRRHLSNTYHDGKPLHVTNRWCVVGEIVKRYGPNGNHLGITFMATFEDGNKAVLHSDLTAGWVVKRSSIPEKTEPEVLQEQLEKFAADVASGKVILPPNTGILEEALKTMLPDLVGQPPDITKGIVASRTPRNAAPAFNLRRELGFAQRSPITRTKDV